MFCSKSVQKRTFPKHVVRKKIIVLNKKHKHLSKGMKRKEVWKEGGNKKWRVGEGELIKVFEFQIDDMAH